MAASEKRETTTSRWTMHLNRLEMGTTRQALPGIEERREWGHILNGLSVAMADRRAEASIVSKCR